MSELPPADAAEALGRQLADGLAALRAGRPAQAAACFEVVCTDKALSEARDLRDVRARALSLWAQALHQSGAPTAALARAEQALRAARLLGDTEGVADVEALRTAIQMANNPVNPPTAGHPGLSESAGPEALLQHAAACQAAGDGAGAATAAERALGLAGDPGTADSLRIAVLARCTLARALADADPTGAAKHLQVALHAARDADVFNLVGTVARTAELLGLANEIA